VLPAFGALGLIWGSSFLFIKVAVEQLPPAYLALARVALGAVALLLVVLGTRDRLPREPRLWGHLAVIALLANAAPFMLFAYAEQRVSSVLAGIWNGVTPLTTLLVTLVALPEERPTRQRLAGLALGFAGVLVVLGAWRGVGSASLPGQLMLFGAVTCYGFGFPYMRRFLAGRPYSGVALSTGQLMVATVQLAIIAPLVAGPPPAPWHLSAAVAGSIGALGVLGTGLAFALNFHVVRVAGATTAATVTYLPPVVATIAGVAVLHERLTWNQPVGAVVVLAGVALSQGALKRLGGLMRLGALKRLRGLARLRARVAGGPRDQAVGGPGVDDALRWDAARHGSGAPVGQPVELAGCVCVGVDGEHATELHRQA